MNSSTIPGALQTLQQIFEKANIRANLSIKINSKQLGGEFAGLITANIPADSSIKLCNTLTYKLWLQILSPLQAVQGGGSWLRSRPPSAPHTGAPPPPPERRSEPEGTQTERPFVIHLYPRLWLPSSHLLSSISPTHCHPASTMTPGCHPATVIIYFDVRFS